MFYKVIKDGKVIDVLDRLVYLKYQQEHGVMLLTDINDAQAILSSDNNTIWHERTLYDIPVEGYDTVEVVEIDKYEYDQLKVLNMKTPTEIIDEYNLLLLEMGVI